MHETRFPSPITRWLVVRYCCDEIPKMGAAIHGCHRRKQSLIVHSGQSSERIARWAYSQAAAAHALTWIRSREFQPIDEACVHLLS